MKISIKEANVILKKKGSNSLKVAWFLTMTLSHSSNQFLYVYIVKAVKPIQ